MRKVVICAALVCGLALIGDLLTGNSSSTPPPLSLSDHELIQRAEVATEGPIDSPTASPSYESYLPPKYADGSRTAPSFEDCTQDCSGHDAGYEWAEENDIRDPGDCDGNSQSFIEGCEERAEEWQSSNPEEQPEEI